ncbi:MAG: hypothetical protein ABI625_27300 [bacterium]
MPRTEIKTPGGHLVGFIREDGNGHFVVYNAVSHAIGYYDPRTNTTCTTGGTFIARGNISSSLIVDHIWDE